MTPLLTLAELAQRWRITEAAAKEVVRARGVPMIGLTPSDLRIVWDRARFSVEAIEAWERSESKACSPPPVRERGKSRGKARPLRVSRLGDYRREA